MKRKEPYDSKRIYLLLIKAVIIYTCSITATERRASYSHFKALAISPTSLFAPTMDKEGTTFADVWEVSPIRHPQWTRREQPLLTSGSQSNKAPSI